MDTSTVLTNYPCIN